jgi:hypothetical protein
LCDTSPNDTGLVPEPLFGLGQFVAEMGDALAAKALQLHPFQIEAETEEEAQKIAYNLDVVPKNEADKAKIYWNSENIEVE